MKRIEIIGIGVIFLLFFNFRAFGQQPSIFVDTSTGRITVKATRKQLKDIEELISQFPTKTRQVQIKARILEMSEEAAEEFGTYLQRLTGVKVPLGETAGEGTTIQYGPESLAELEEGKGAILINFYRLIAGEEKFEAILNMLISQGKVKVLSEPQVTTMSGEVAGIYVTQDIPYLSEITYTTVGEERVPEYHYAYATVGVILEVLPKIVGEDLIQMSVIPIVGDYEISAEFGADKPIFKRQVAPTNITIKNGEPLIIGGLVQEKKDKKETRFPILSDLPVLGNLFKSYREVRTSRHLVITIKPHILSQREIKGRTKRIFTFKYALAEEIPFRIKELLSPEGTIEVNPKEAPPNSILVRDSEDRIEMVQEMLNRIGTFEEQRRQKTFHLTFSSAYEAEEVLSPFLSPKGSIYVDEKTNSITIEDGAYQLMRMEKALTSLEKHNQIPQKKIFHLKYAKEEEIVPLLQRLLSPQGKIEILENSLLVLDNNWVIQRIAKEIERLDTFETWKKTGTFPLEYVDAEKLSRSDKFKEAFSSLVCDKATVKVSAEKNELVITALRWRLSEIRKLVKSFDVYQPQKAVYRLNYSLASSMVEKLKPFLSDKGQIEFDEEENSLSVTDSKYRIELIKKRLSQLDTFEREKKREKIRLKYMTVAQAVSLIEAIKSPQGKIEEKNEGKKEILIEEASYPLQRIKRIIAQMDTLNDSKT